MLRIITILTLLFAALTARCEPTPPAANLYYESEESGTSDDKDRPSRGHRMPPAPIPCTIDFDNQSITGNSPLLDAIVEYQLLDAEGYVIIVSDISEQSFVEELSHANPGNYILLLVADGYQLSGTLNL